MGSYSHPHHDAGTRIAGLQEIIATVNPFVDIDVSFTYNGDGTVASIVYTGLEKTKTLVFTWAVGELQSIACVIT